MAFDSRWNNVPRLEYRSEDIKRQIGILDAVRMYTGEAPNRERKIHCPDPNHDDASPSCAVDERKHPTTCHCFSCGGTFDVFDLAKFAKGIDNFAELAEEVCKDFGIDRYAVSNLAEREAAIEREFGKGRQTKESYREFFPLSSSELATIGLHDSNNRSEMLFSVSAEDYYINAYFDKADLKKYGKPASELSSEERSEYISELPKRIRANIYDKSGHSASIQVSYHEAVEIGRNVNPEYLMIQSQVKSMGCNVDDKGHAYLPAHSFRDLWDGDKRGTEKIIMDKISDTTEYLGYKISALTASRNDYEKGHDLEREEKLLALYTESATSSSMMWTEAQKHRLQELIDYKHDAVEIQCCKEILQDVEKIYDKMNNFLIRRAEHEAEYGDVPNETNPSTPDLPE